VGLRLVVEDEDVEGGRLAQYQVVDRAVGVECGDLRIASIVANAAGSVCVPWGNVPPPSPGGFAVLALTLVLASAAQDPEQPGPDITIIDAHDGRPVPALAVLGLGLELADGMAMTSHDGGIRVASRLRPGASGSVEPPTGAVELQFFDQGMELLRPDHQPSGFWEERTVTFPTSGPIAIEIGPTFLLDLPDWIPDETRQQLPYGPSTTNLEVSAVDTAGRLHDMPASLRDERWAFHRHERWTRFRAPLDAQYDELRIRWGDPFLEARAALPRHAGRRDEPVTFERVALGGVQFRLPTEMRGSVVVERADTPDELPYVAFVPSTAPKLERLPPGRYRWRFGPDDAWPHGEFDVVAGAVQRVEVPRAEPGPDPIRIPIEVEGERPLVVGGFLMDHEPGHYERVRSSLVDMGGRSVPLQAREGGGFAALLPSVPAGGATFVVGWYDDPDGDVAYRVSSRVTRAGLDSPLVVAVVPTTEVRIHALDPEGRTPGEPLVARWKAFGVQSRPVSMDDAGPLVLNLPADRPTGVLLGATERQQGAYFLFEPNHWRRTFRVRLRPLSHLFLGLQTVDTDLRPIADVEIRVKGEVVGHTDAAGYAWIRQDPRWHRLEGFSVGHDGDGLTPVVPPRRQVWVEDLRASYFEPVLVLRR